MESTIEFDELDEILMNMKKNMRAVVIEEKCPNPNFAQGWVCPRCGRVNAPWVATCPCSIKYEITC